MSILQTGTHTRRKPEPGLGHADDQAEPGLARPRGRPSRTWAPPHLDDQTEPGSPHLEDKTRSPLRPSKQGDLKATLPDRRHPAEDRRTEASPPPFIRKVRRGEP
jgi:hypothetical protein